MAESDAEKQSIKNKKFQNTSYNLTKHGWK